MSESAPRAHGAPESNEDAELQKLRDLVAAILAEGPVDTATKAGREVAIGEEALKKYFAK